MLTPTKPLCCSGPVPWVAATELQPHQAQSDQRAIDAVEEMSMESFPCSDPPCHRSPKAPDEDDPGELSH